MVGPRGAPGAHCLRYRGLDDPAIGGKTSGRKSATDTREGARSPAGTKKGRRYETV
ncbi:MAG: hypothetical protein MSC57_02785 [Peptoniphilaceae bacterium]|nr:hypothetical protein [Peptoniphilaceae bacterium]